MDKILFWLSFWVTVIFASLVVIFTIAWIWIYYRTNQAFQGRRQR